MNAQLCFLFDFENSQWIPNQRLIDLLNLTAPSFVNDNGPGDTWSLTIT
jgi:hypothetical protein